jgi:hypothetical protein
LIVLRTKKGGSAALFYFITIAIAAGDATA